MALNYLLSPTFQAVSTAGKPLTGGYIETYLAGTRTKYYCASDFSGTLHPFKIPLDALGSNIVLADDSQSYDVYIYNRYGSLSMSRYNVNPAEGGGVSNTNITSNDGSITVINTANGVDLSVTDNHPDVLVCTGESALTDDGTFDVRKGSGTGEALSVVSNAVHIADHDWYNYEAMVRLHWGGPVQNTVQSITVSCTGGGYQLVDFDMSDLRDETVTVSGAFVSGGMFACSVAGLPQGMTAELIKLSIFKISSRNTQSGGGSDLPDYDYSNAGQVLTVNSDGTDIEWANQQTITIDQHYDPTSTNAQSGTAVAEAVSGKQDTLTAGQGISIQNNVISATGGGSGIPGYDDLQFKLSTYEYPKNKSVTYTDDGKGVVCSYPLYGAGTSSAPSIDDTTIRDKMCLGDGNDGVWFRLASPAYVTNSSGQPSNSYGRALTCSQAMGAAGLRPILFKVSDPTVYYTFPNTVVPTCDGAATNPNGYQCGFVGVVMNADTHTENATWKTIDMGQNYPTYSYWEILVHLTQSDMLDANGNPASAYLWMLLQGFGGTYALGFYQPGTTGSYPNGCDGAAWVSNFTDYASTYQIQPDLLQNKYAYFPELPNNYGSVIGGKTISTKRNSSDLEWVDLPQVDDQYSAFSLNAQSGFAVAEAISGVRQVPSTTTALAGDVLTVAQDGNSIGWAAPASGGHTISVLDEQKSVTIVADSYTWPNAAASFDTTINPGDSFVGSIVLQAADFSSGALTYIDLGYTCASNANQYNYVRIQGEGTYIIPVAITNSGSTSDTIGLTINGTVSQNTTFTMEFNGLVFG